MESGCNKNKVGCNETRTFTTYSINNRASKRRREYYVGYNVGTGMNEMNVNK